MTTHAHPIPEAAAWRFGYCAGVVGATPSA